MKFKILKKTTFGYDSPAHRFECPLCWEKTHWDLDKVFVLNRAMRHLLGAHNVVQERIKFKFKKVR